MEQLSKEINGTVYKVTQMPGTRALRAQTRLVGLVGKGIFEIFGKVDIKKVANGTLGVDDKILEAIAPIFDKFDDEKAFTFVKSLFENGVFVEKENPDNQEKISIPLNFETAFIGKAMDMWKVVAFILQANFSQGKQ